MIKATNDLAGGPVFKARRILVATGLRDELPDIPGLRERWGKDLLHCPYCHIYEVRDQPLAVLRTGPGAVHQALLPRIVEGRIGHVVTEGDRLQGVALTDGRSVPRAAVFLFPRMVPQDDLLTRLGCAKDGRVTTDRTGRTSVDGVWAAGNVIDPRAQVVTAAGMGSAAAFAINTDLLEEDVDHAVQRRRAEARGDGR
ncbi:NAD(P)/FAD-dependent oxidoreductase [Spirillospora sp. CA-142024]|uniref:NAD(P)/FAD-dependent oxidoreductase n=1 Tax=Spirillospora sp. CA-142024 TaxID=3240036 RepID=UPI003D8F9569